MINYYFLYPSPDIKFHLSDWGIALIFIAAIWILTEIALRIQYSRLKKRTPEAALLCEKLNGPKWDPFYSTKQFLAKNKISEKGLRYFYFFHIETLDVLLKSKKIWAFKKVKTIFGKSKWIFYGVK